jgi:hypothetical protein
MGRGPVNSRLWSGRAHRHGRRQEESISRARAADWRAYIQPGGIGFARVAFGMAADKAVVVWSRGQMVARGTSFSRTAASRGGYLFPSPERCPGAAEESIHSADSDLRAVISRKQMLQSAKVGSDQRDQDHGGGG